ncbi:MAG: IS110 family transposase [Nitrospirota bacterium]|nr:IS110 family transposase [Nitrospirota bacterium]
MRQITFPELETRCNVFSETTRDFLKQFPSGRMIRAADIKAVQRALTHYDGRKTASFYAEDFVTFARRSVTGDSIARELLIPEKIATLEHLIEKREKIAKALLVACEALMIEDIEIITSIGGIGNTTASAFLAEVGNYKDFPSYKHLISFAGLNPSIHQSGKFEGSSRISMRGNRHLRHLIYLMTTCVVRQNNIFRVYYFKRRKDYRSKSDPCNSP